MTHSRTAGAQWQASGRPAGRDGALGWRTALSWADSAMQRDLYATNPANGTQMQRFGSYDLGAQNLQALAAADWRLAPDWTLLGSVQWSHLTRDAQSRSSAAQLNQDWSFATPKIGLNWAATPTTRLWANLSRSHEAPTFWGDRQRHRGAQQPAAAQAELVRLKMQRATTVELAVPVAGARAPMPCIGRPPCTAVCWPTS